MINVRTYVSRNKNLILFLYFSATAFSAKRPESREDEGSWENVISTVSEFLNDACEI